MDFNDDDDMPMLQPPPFVVNPISATIYPLCFHSTLLESELAQAECGDGIYLSSERFQHFNNVDSDALVVIKITKGARSAYASITGFHTDDRDSVYMPSWMCQYLDGDCGDTVSMSKLADYRTGLDIQIQPHESWYATLDDPTSALRNAFENYTIIQSGTDIPLYVNGKKLIVSIIDTHNEGPVCIRGVELAVNIDRPLDMPDAQVQAQEQEQMQVPTLVNTIEEPIDFNSMIPLPKPVDTGHFPGRGRVLGGGPKK
jgi:hypothetical protein